MSLKELYYIDIIPYNSSSKASVVTGDARQIKQICDFWVTDPPYADAVKLHELSDFLPCHGERSD
jgi:adenine-specific DNA methylase